MSDRLHVTSEQTTRRGSTSTTSSPSISTTLPPSTSTTLPPPTSTTLPPYTSIHSLCYTFAKPPTHTHNRRLGTHHTQPTIPEKALTTLPLQKPTLLPPTRSTRTPRHIGPPTRDSRRRNLRSAALQFADNLQRWKKGGSLEQSARFGARRILALHPMRRDTTLGWLLINPKQPD